MKSAFIQLKNGYNTVLPNVEFITDENGLLQLWTEKGRVGLFLLDQVEMCVITGKFTQEGER
jgi:hypothetical protein